MTGVKNKIKYTAAVVLTLFFTAYLLIFGGAAREAAKGGLDVCFDVILTAVFPFSVASKLLISSGVCGFLGKTAAKPLARLLGLSPSGAGVFLLGLVGGYPTGASGAAELYRSGLISKSEAEVVISYSNNATPAFMINYIGLLIGSKRLGLIFYTVNICAALIWALFLRKKTGPEYKTVSKPLDFSFISAVKSCGGQILNVCFFIIVFAVISSVFSLLPPPFSSVFRGFTELTTGAAVLSGADLPARITASLICAASSFSGLCVASQVISVSRGAGIGVKYYVCGKIFQSVISFFAVFILYPYILS